MIVQISPNYRLKQYDKRNWVLEELRTPKRATSDTTDLNQEKWFSCDCYFQSFGAALKHVYEHVLLNMNEKLTVQEAIKKASEIEKSLKEFSLESIKKEG